MNFSVYPKWKYHATKPARIVKDAIEEHELGEEWFDSRKELREGRKPQPGLNRQADFKDGDLIKVDGRDYVIGAGYLDEARPQIDINSGLLKEISEEEQHTPQKPAKKGHSK